MTKESMQLAFEDVKPFLGVVFLQVGIISKVALNEGMSNFVFAVYRQAVASRRPRHRSFRLFLDKLEKVNMMSIRSQAKLLGTLATVAGAMIMTLVRGPNLDFPWTRGATSPAHQQPEVSLQHSIKGAIFLTIGCFGWASFMILQCSGIAYYLQGVVMKERGPVFVTGFSPLNMVIVAILSSLILAEKVFLGRVVGAFVIVLGQAEKPQFPCDGSRRESSKANQTWT